MQVMKGVILESAQNALTNRSNWVVAVAARWVGSYDNIIADQLRLIFKLFELTLSSHLVLAGRENITPRIFPAKYFQARLVLG